MFSSSEGGYQVYPESTASFPSKSTPALQVTAMDTAAAALAGSPPQVLLRDVFRRVLGRAGVLVQRVKPRREYFEPDRYSTEMPFLTTFWPND
jgi:hypothetical protein